MLQHKSEHRNIAGLVFSYTSFSMPVISSQIIRALANAAAASGQIHAMGRIQIFLQMLI